MGWQFGPPSWIRTPQRDFGWSTMNEPWHHRPCCRFNAAKALIAGFGHGPGKSAILFSFEANLTGG